MAVGFTRRGEQRFVQWVTGLALNPEVEPAPSPSRWWRWAGSRTAAAGDVCRVRLLGPARLQAGVAARVGRPPRPRFHGYHAFAGDDTKVHRSSEGVWGTCTFHEYTARCPNRATTARPPTGSPGKRCFLTGAARPVLLWRPQLLVLRFSRRPERPPVAFRTKCQLLVEMAASASTAAFPARRWGCSTAATPSGLGAPLARPRAPASGGSTS
ncbi:MAG: hypothetical protein U0797_11590 [Gemmataceae bacterium]